MGGLRLPFSTRCVLLLNLVLAQASLLLFIGLLQGVNVFGFLKGRSLLSTPKFFLGAVFFCGLLTIAILRILGKIVEAESEARINRLRYQETRQLLDMLRAQRHDFLNHLQVISGLLQIGRFETARNYIGQVNQEISRPSNVFQNLLHRPEVAGLLLRKMEQAEASGVSFTVNLKTDLTSLGVPPLDFIRVLGNLIDNALDAVSSVPPEKRRVRVEISEGEHFYEIRVNNFRPLIPVRNLQKVFQKGFTTKKGKNEGFGLFIVKSLVEKHRGKIRVESNLVEGTTFVVSFPIHSCSRLSSQVKLPSA
ncbi:MAG: Signal transduction histidine kinase regulating citrate/malate metabolism [Thermoanaerobacterales bacterium 50_218]|nr:MAG: Signal transduction histidine kinase regulating citrate/malate metabolism [Thermoanaerobacterales bacterium 50_218]HAA89911.1 hypothetical protein [Peptococcaceae bacterium]